MKQHYWALLFFNYFAMGIMVPVLSLALLDKGLDLTSLALIFGLYTLTVVILEVPSGIMADLIGRKRVFLISNVFYIVSAALLLFAHGVALMIPVIIFWGAGKAFASGSMDALAIDSYVELNGTESMPVVTSRLALLETIGLSTGALLGGFLPGLTKGLLPFFGTYDITILLRSVLIVINTILCAAFIKEYRPHGTHVPKLKEHVAQSVRFIKRSPVLLLLAAGLFCTGISMFTVETYWQPVYITVLNNDSLSWTLGFLSFGCFLFASVGNIIIKKIFMSRQSIWHIGYTVTRLALYAALVVFSFMQSAVSFAAMFYIVYFLFGASNMAESTMLNIEIPAEKRASLLSFVSFVFQAGGIVAPVTAALASTQPGIRTLWLFSGIAFFVVSAVIGTALLRLSRKRCAIAAMQTSSPENVFRA